MLERINKTIKQAHEYTRLRIWCRKESCIHQTRHCGNSELLTFSWFVQRFAGRKSNNQVSKRRRSTSTIITATNAGTYSVGEVSGGSVYFAGGGGAGAYSLNGTGVRGTGGLGGGGNGGRNGLNSIAGTDYTGGGGGGQGLTSGGTAQGSRVAGGDGVVILKMPVSNYSGTYTGSSVNSFVQGNDRVLIFKSSGTYTA